MAAAIRRLAARQGTHRRVARVRDRAVKIYLSTPNQLARHSTMHLRRVLLGSVFCASALAALSPIAHSQEREAPPVREVQEIPLPGVQGRLDHFTIDLKRKRVIFSGLGNNTVARLLVFEAQTE